MFMVSHNYQGFYKKKGQGLINGGALGVKKM